MPEAGPIVLGRAAVRAVDKAASDELGIPSIILMENAAMALERACVAWLQERNAAVVVVCGPGNNGGDGLALARRLFVRGVKVSAALCAPRERFKGDALTNLTSVEKLGVELRWISDPSALDGLTGASGSELIVDALFGTGLDRPVTGVAASAVEWINARHAAGARVLAVDIPSGLDCDSGDPFGGACVIADQTVTMCALKQGFSNPGSRRFTGAVTVGSIGVPASLIERCART